MEDREKLENPTLEFTPVTLLSGGGSCETPTESECPYWVKSDAQWCRTVGTGG